MLSTVAKKISPARSIAVVIIPKILSSLGSPAIANVVGDALGAKKPIEDTTSIIPNTPKIIVTITSSSMFLICGGCI